MKVEGLKGLMKWLSLPIMVGGGALAVYGISGFSASLETWARINTLDGNARWSSDSRIEITIGVTLFILGKFMERHSE